MPQTGQYSATDLQPAPPQTTGQYSSADLAPAAPRSGGAFTNQQFHDAYNALPFWQRMKLEVIPGAMEEWKAKTFNQGLYIPGSEPLERVLRPATGEMLGGAADVAQGDVTRGAHRIISGAGTATLPLLPAAAGKAPGAVLKALVGGTVAGTATKAAAGALGATPGQAALAGDVGGLAGGAASQTKIGGKAVEMAAEHSLGIGLLGRTLKFAGDILHKLPANPSPDSHPEAFGLLGKLLESVETKLSPQLDAKSLAPMPDAAPPAQPGPVLVPKSTEPIDMSKFYGQSSGRSNLKANQRQLASPTASSAPNPSNQGAWPQQIMEILKKPGDLSADDITTLDKYDFAKRAWK